MNFSDYEFISSIESSLNTSVNNSNQNSSDESGTEYEYFMINKTGSCPDLKRFGTQVKLKRINSSPSLKDEEILSNDISKWSEEQEKLLDNWVDENTNNDENNDENVWNLNENNTEWGDYIKSQPECSQDCWGEKEWSNAWINWDKQARQDKEWPSENWVSDKNWSLPQTKSSKEKLFSLGEDEFEEEPKKNFEEDTFCFKLKKNFMNGINVIVTTFKNFYSWLCNIF
jgi:hypothetical protein